MSRITTLIMVLATSFVVAFTFACVAVETITPTFAPTPGPKPTPTVSAADVAALRVATLTAFYQGASDSRIIALTAESEAVAAEAILNNAPENEKAKWEATATVTRSIAESANATAVAATRAELPESLATEVADLAATQVADDALSRSLERRRENCQRADEIRSEVSAADRWYANRDVSVGELSVFHPAEATARAEALQRAADLCP